MTRNACVTSNNNNNDKNNHNENNKNNDNNKRLFRFSISARRKKKNRPTTTTTTKMAAGTCGSKVSVTQLRGAKSTGALLPASPSPSSRQRHQHQHLHPIDSKTATRGGCSGGGSVSHPLGDRAVSLCRELQVKRDIAKERY